jgi:1,4-dihydroxy-2-naphthoate octaprenyltransferase
MVWECLFLVDQVDLLLIHKENIMNTTIVWLKASRLPSQSYIFLPLLFGQAYYVFQGGKLDLYILLLVHLFGLFNQLYIVYANDYADIEADRLNNTFNIFSRRFQGID